VAEPTNVSGSRRNGPTKQRFALPIVLKEQPAAGEKAFAVAASVASASVPNPCSSWSSKALAVACWLGGKVADQHGAATGQDGLAAAHALLRGSTLAPQGRSLVPQVSGVFADRPLESQGIAQQSRRIA